MANNMVNSPNLLKDIRNKLLSVDLPSSFIGITIDAINHHFNETDSSFLEFIQTKPSQFDIILGKVEEASFPISVLIATAVKLNILRIAKPSFPGYYFDKSRLWEKGILPPHEIIKTLQDDLSFLLKDSELRISLFYGRIDLEYNTFSYVDCGFSKFIHFHSKRQEYVFLDGKCPPLTAKIQNNFPTKLVPINNGDCFIFHFDDTTPIKYFLKQHFLPILTNYPNSQASELVEHIQTSLKNSHIEILNEEHSPIALLKVNNEENCFSSQIKTTKFAADLSQLQAARTFVQHICSHLPGDLKKMTFQLQLVINEIFCNIVKHGHLSEVKGEIIIESQISQEGIFIIVSDKGNSFDPLKVNYPNLTGAEDGGFGLFIIEQLVDNLSYIPKNSTDEWNHLCIFKRYFSEEEQMEFSHQIRENTLIVVPQGESLDAKNAPAFKEALLGLIQTHNLSQLVIDLSHLQFIDSSGLGIFLSLQRTLNSQGGVLKLASLNKPIRTMFEIVSMHRIFEIFNTPEEALQSF